MDVAVDDDDTAGAPLRLHRRRPKKGDALDFGRRQRAGDDPRQTARVMREQDRISASVAAGGSTN